MDGFSAGEPAREASLPSAVMRWSAREATKPTIASSYIIILNRAKRPFKRRGLRTFRLDTPSLRLPGRDSIVANVFIQIGDAQEQFQ